MDINAIDLGKSTSMLNISDETETDGGFFLMPPCPTLQRSLPIPFDDGVPATSSIWHWAPIVQALSSFPEKEGKTSGDPHF